MGLRIFFVFLIFFMFMPKSYSGEKAYIDEVMKLKNINSNLNKQLSSAVGEINKLQEENKELKSLASVQVELEKIRRELENKSSEVKMLREQIMMSKDYALNGR